MPQPGWRWLVPDRSRLIVLLIALMGLTAGVSFVDLGIRRSAAVAANQAAHRQLDEAKRQQALLTQALADAQQGTHITPKAYDYFGQTPPGVTTILIKPATQAGAAQDAAAHFSGPPFWHAWWERLVKP